MANKVFLTARWSHLAMLNFEVDPALLGPHKPVGTELDDFHGKHMVSMVGFLFHDARAWDLSLPFHRHFSEVNLRFYVRYLSEVGWRRGVVFIKEIVPRRAVALVARSLFEENFVALPMRYEISPRPEAPETPARADYRWKQASRWHHLAVESTGPAGLPAPGSEEEFIVEHYWGYTARRDGTTSEYQVEHTPWRVWQASNAEFECDVATLYGSEFAEPLSQSPCSAFLAEGSPVAVCRGRRLPGVLPSCEEAELAIC